MTHQSDLDAGGPTVAWAGAFKAHNADRLVALYDSEAILGGTLMPRLITSGPEVSYDFERAFQGSLDVQVSFQETFVRSFEDYFISTGSYVLQSPAQLER